MDIVYNAAGNPLSAFGRTTLMQSQGVTAAAPGSGTKLNSGTNPLKPIIFALATKEIQVSPWGHNNKFPTVAEELIGKVGVLNTGLRFIRNVILGQGIYPCTIDGYDSDGNELLKIIEDPKVRQFLNGRMVRKYMEKAVRDFLKYGVAFPELVPSNDGKSIVGLNCINAIYSRYSVANEMGDIEYCVVSGAWPDLPTDEAGISVIPMLGEYDPEEDLNRLRLERKLNQTVIYPLRDSWSNKDYYSAPAWWPTKEAGWLELATMVPKFLKKAYENQIAWKWHVKIPYAFWDKRFPTTEYPDSDKRKEAINKYLDDLEKNLCAPENANKAIITMFEIGAGGKAEEQWEIDALDNKYTNETQLITSAAANSEILFSLMINPNVLGAGMPGGTYAGNQGGSNIREAFLVNIANSWPERQTLLDPIELYLRSNGVKDVELRFRNTILTTLDTGAGTKKTLS
jgi:hypothetical protein